MSTLLQYMLKLATLKLILTIWREVVFDYYI